MPYTLPTRYKLFMVAPCVVIYGPGHWWHPSRITPATSKPTAEIIASTSSNVTTRFSTQKRNSFFPSHQRSGAILDTRGRVTLMVTFSPSNAITLHYTASISHSKRMGARPRFARLVAQRLLLWARPLFSIQCRAVFAFGFAALRKLG